MEKLISFHDISYEIKPKSLLGLTIYEINSLDKAIDDLCEKLGDQFMDDALKEDYCPYFGLVWDAGMGLATYLKNIDLKNKRILEIGCGLALPSFIATQKGAEVLATDYHHDVERFLNLNQKINEVNFSFERMNWRKEEKDLGLFDLVIGSDILYESAHPDQVAKALIRNLNKNGKIILADPGRSYIQKFVTSMNSLGYKEFFNPISIISPKNQKPMDIFIFEFSSQE